MTDDLVKQLRAAGRAFIDNQYSLYTRAADRIEQLEAALLEITKTAPFGHPQEIARAALGEKKDG